MAVGLLEAGQGGAPVALPTGDREIGDCAATRRQEQFPKIPRDSKGLEAASPPGGGGGR